MLELELITTKLTNEFTEGKIYRLNDNTFVCDSLEDVVRDVNDNGVFDNGEAKQYGETAILSGIFDLEVVWSPALKKEVVHLINTPEFTYIYLHWGYDVLRSLGCILVGKKISDGKLKNTGMTDKLVKMLKNYGGKGTIKISRGKVQ